MSGSVYSFRAGPTYRAASRQELFDSAMEQPLSLTSTFFDQAKGGMLESYGLGTAVRDFAIPEGVATPGTTVRSALRLTNPLTAAYESTRLAVQAFREESPVLDEAKYKSSPWYRENIPWDAGMTEARAKALAEWNDAKQVRQYYAQKRPISAYLGNLTGQAFDPINYVPVGGPLVRAAAVARAGRVGGAVVTGAVDAATNTALAGLATRETRGRFGDDVSFQAMVSEIATAALIGAAFGGISGAMEARKAARALADAQRTLSTLKATQDARIALNEAIDGVVRGEDITLSPNATEAVARKADVVAPKFSVEMRNYSGGQSDLTLRAKVGGTEVGRIDFSEFDGAPAIQMIEVSPEFRRSGYATQMLRELQARYPEQEIDWGMLTPDGARLREAISFRDVPTSESGKFAELDALRIEESTLAKEIEQGWEQGKGVDDQPPSIRAKVERSYEIGNEISDLEWELRGAKATKQIMDIPRIETIQPRPVVASPARPVAAPEGRALAETRIAKPDNYKALADQYRVDPETGDFPELADIDNLRAEGRLTADDIAELDAAKATLDDANAYAEALRTVVGCLV